MTNVFPAKSHYSLCGTVTFTVPSAMFDCSCYCLYNIMTHAISHIEMLKCNIWRERERCAM